MTVTAAYAKVNLPKLLKAVESGKTVTISRYNKPIAELSPLKTAPKPPRKLGTLKGKFTVDPKAFEPMTDQEVESFISTGRY